MTWTVTFVLSEYVQIRCFKVEATNATQAARKAENLLLSKRPDYRNELLDARVEVELDHK